MPYQDENITKIFIMTKMIYDLIIHMNKIINMSIIRIDTNESKIIISITKDE